MLILPILFQLTPIADTVDFNTNNFVIYFRRHRRMLSDAPIFQPSAIKLFRSLLPDCGTLCRWTSRRRRRYLFSGNVGIPVSSVIFPLNLL